MTHPDDESDNCSCLKGGGSWGSSGFHWRYAGNLECFVLADNPDDPDRSPCYRGKSRQACLDAGGCIYKSREVAYERCKAYMAAWKAGRRAERTKKERGQQDEVFV